MRRNSTRRSWWASRPRSGTSALTGTRRRSSFGGQWFVVTGILSSDTYAPELDSAVMVGFPAAQRYLGFDGHPSQIYVRRTVVRRDRDPQLGYLCAGTRLGGHGGLPGRAAVPRL